MAAPVSRVSREVPDWLKPRMAWMAGPSWLCSAVFHVLAAILIWQLAQSPGCRTTRGEQIRDDGREVGIFVRPPGPETTEIESPAPESPSTTSTTAPLAADSPPVDLSLPSIAAPGVLGNGAPPSLIPRLPTGGAPSRGAPPSEAAHGIKATSMFGVASKGRRFVYVIDRSASMVIALRAAKGELLASTRRLDAEQQFQVVFFNNLPRALSTRHDVFSGTDSHRLEAEKQIAEIGAEGGTQRLLALEKAFTFNPDVIYFLTDSGDPMSTRDLEDVRRHNHSDAQINCIEFGEGPELRDAQGRPVTNFLHKIAATTGGAYAYRDLSAPSRDPAARPTP